VIVPDGDSSSPNVPAGTGGPKSKLNSSSSSSSSVGVGGNKNV